MIKDYRFDFIDYDFGPDKLKEVLAKHGGTLVSRQDQGGTDELPEYQISIDDGKIKACLTELFQTEPSDEDIKLMEAAAL